MKQLYIKQYICKLTVKIFFLQSLQCYFLLLTPNSHRTKLPKIISLFLPQRSYQFPWTSQERLPNLYLEPGQLPRILYLSFGCWCHRHLSLDKRNPHPSPRHPTYTEHIFSNQLPFPTAIFLLITIF